MRRLLVPEVVQTSAMDCGPASLKCLLEGFGVSASYGRLREACQTDVDGTSIDTLEEIAVELGLDAEQVMIPVDHLLLDESAALPAIVVVRLPSGFTHFVVAWRRSGPLMQVMDPASGRRWVTCERFLQEVYVHQTNVPAEAFEEWTQSDDFSAPLLRRMRDLGLSPVARTQLIEAAAPSGGVGAARLDAAVRMVAAMVGSEAIRRGSDAERLVTAVLAEADAIPPTYFTARPDPASKPEEPQVHLRGAVVLRVRGAGAPPEGARPLSPELAQALAEAPARPMRTLVAMVREGGWLAPGILLTATAIAAAGALVEATLLRASLDLPNLLGTIQQRLGAVAALIIFAASLRAVDGPVVAGTLRIGRQIELRLRRAFLEKLPRLGDRYLQSRPISDMAERAHAIHTVRDLPDLAARLVRASIEMAITGTAIAWLYPACTWIAVAACLCAVGVPWVWQPVLLERDLRVRSHGGALARLSLDSLLGLMPIRTHAAEGAMLREHESLLVEWSRASRALMRAAAWAETLQWLTTIGAVAWMVQRYLSHTQETRGVLLLVYWGLYLQALGEDLGLALRQIPGQRNITLRLLEPLGAIEETSAPSAAAQRPEAALGAAIEMTGVGVLAAGHTILSEISTRIAPGEQVAIVGPSGAGKSSLVGVLLGWHRPSGGTVLVDGVPLTGEWLDQLRSCTAWVDPSVQVWNRALLDNLRYGAAPGADAALAQILEGANVQPLLDRLPEGLQTPLGEGGALVSGGEGQRVRLGRAMMRKPARLVIFDEPFRGLDRDKRRELLKRARTWWPGATLVCITHDIAETRDFARVLVIERGRIVEDGDPARLAADATSRYSAMLASERGLIETLWGGPGWRRIRMEGGRLSEPRAATEAPAPARKGA